MDLMKKLMVFVVTFMPVPTLAHDGLLDTTFGIGGYSIFLPFSGEYLYGVASKSVLAQQFPTGKIIVASSVVRATGDVDFVVMRLLEDGSSEIVKQAVGAPHCVSLRRFCQRGTQFLS